MASEVAAQQPRAGMGPRGKAKLSLWDRIMRHSDIGIGAWAIITYIFLYLPIVVLIIFSFNKQVLNITWEGFTFDWYIAKQGAPGQDPRVIGVLRDPAILQAFLTSLEIALLSTIGSVVIGVLGSFALVRFEFRTKTVWDGLNYTKIIIAEVVAGVSTLLFFVQLNNFLDQYVGFDFFNIFQPGFWTVVIAHIAWNIPFVVVIIRARLLGFDRSIEEAGADLGANPVSVFFRVTLPVIFPGILAASLLAFTLSFDDFVTTFFVIGQNYNTLPLKIWSMVRMGITPEINAISTFMMAFSMTIIIFLELKARVSEVL
jgi:spermidine/putrescine transport system permease protein